MRLGLLPEGSYACDNCDTADPQLAIEASPYYTPPPCVCTRALADLEEDWADNLGTMRRHFPPYCGTES